MRLVCFANPDSRRVKELSAACGKLPLAIVPWVDVITGEWDRSVLRGESVLRLESPGKDAAVERELMIAGSAAAREDPDAFWRMTSRQIREAKWEHGRIPPLRQWFLGWRRVLHGLAAEAGTDARWFTPPEDVLSMFDKADCHLRLQTHGCPVPQGFGVMHDYFHLMQSTGEAGLRRFFLKACHTSSSSGLMAIEHGPNGMQAFTTVELEQGSLEPVMFNSRKVLRVTGDAVMETADAICRLRATAQAWVPKAGWRGQRMDLRIVTIGGKAMHVVPRLSATPFTALQLGAERGDAGALRAAMGEGGWHRVMAAAESAAAAYPQALCCGVDIAVTPGWSRAFVLEVNAFGDFLPGVLHGGRDAYACQLAAAGLL